MGPSSTSVLFFFGSWNTWLIVDILRIQMVETHWENVSVLFLDSMGNTRCDNGNKRDVLIDTSAIFMLCSLCKPFCFQFKSNTHTHIFTRSDTRIWRNYLKKYQVEARWEERNEEQIICAFISIDRKHFNWWIEVLATIIQSNETEKMTWNVSTYKVYAHSWNIERGHWKRERKKAQKKHTHTLGTSKECA